MEEMIGRLFKFMEVKGLSQNQFEVACGLPHSDLRSRRQGPTASYIAKIITRFPELDLNWLLTGRGTMIISNNANDEQIPLLPFSAAAGWMTENNGADAFRGDLVSFRDFTDRGADCAIRVDGDSMWPKYSSGDILAIRILKDSWPGFFQWGRIYVLNTTQGCVVKRLYPDPDDPDTIICHSENESYPDYKISRTDVLGVAIVVGHAGVE